MPKVSIHLYKDLKNKELSSTISVSTPLHSTHYFFSLTKLSQTRILTGQLWVPLKVSLIGA